jgi:hypothetical protein
MSTAEERAAARAEKYDDSGMPQTHVLEDFLYDRQQEKFWDTGTKTLFDEKGVDAGISRAMWATSGEDKQGRAKLTPPHITLMDRDLGFVVDSAVWWPGREQVLEGVYADGMGVVEDPKKRCFNTYRKASLGSGDAAQATYWVNLVKRLFPGEAEMFFDYCAHMIQRPEEKCNWAVVLSGSQGIGKDTILAPLRTIMHGNCGETTAQSVLSAYHPWVQNVMIVVNETAPDDNHKLVTFYNNMKTIIAAPPTFLTYTNKYEKERYVVNVARVFMTTNNYESLFIPEDDRRYFVMHSAVKHGWHLEADLPDYFAELHASGMRAEDVNAWLGRRDISRFACGAAPASTAAKKLIQAHWNAEPEDAVTVAIDALERPPVLFTFELVAASFDGKREVDAALRGSRSSKHRMAKSGYCPVLPETGGKFAFNAGTRRIQANKAWVRAELAEDHHAALAAILAHGRALSGGGKEAALKAV